MIQPIKRIYACQCPECKVSFTVTEAYFNQFACLKVLWCPYCEAPLYNIPR